MLSASSGTATAERFDLKRAGVGRVQPAREPVEV